jgi:O-antigen/teichoic acid export membrane protein
MRLLTRLLPGERGRAAWQTALAMMVARVAATLTVLLSVPPTLDYLGPERFGIWVTISTLGALIGFADLGLGQGLMNALARTLGQEDPAPRSRLVMAGLWGLAFAGLLLATLSLLLVPRLPLAVLLHLTSVEAVDEARTSVLAYLLCCAAAVAASSVARIQLGLRLGVAGQLWGACGTLAGLLALLLAIRLHLGMAWLVVAQFGTPVGAALLNGWQFFSGDQRKLLVARPDAAMIRTLLGSGSLFLVVQLATVLVMFSDNLIIAQALGPLAVTQFSVPARMFSLIDIALSTTTAALMPAYADAAASGDWAWVHATLRRSLWAVGLTAMAGAILLNLLAPWLLRLWVGTAVRADPLLDLLLGIWIVLVCLHTALGMFLNGIHAARLQISVACAFALLAIAAKPVLVRLMGLPGIPLAGCLAWLLGAGLPYLWWLRAQRRRLRSAGAEVRQR